MSVRPLAIYRDGQLWLDDGGIYEPALKFSVITMRDKMRGWKSEFGNQKADECQAALDQFNAAMEEAK